MAVSTMYGRLAIEVDGKVASVTQACLPQENRCASVYIIDTISRPRQTYAAGATDASLRRNIPVGSAIKKRKWQWTHQIDGKEIDDFPLGFYRVILAFSVATLTHALYARYGTSAGNQR